MDNAGLMRRDAEMTIFQPDFEETRFQELSLLPLFIIQYTIGEEMEEFLHYRCTSKQYQGFRPYQNKPFDKKRPCGGYSTQSSNQSFSSTAAVQVIEATRVSLDHTTETKGNYPTQLVL